MVPEQSSLHLLLKIIDSQLTLTVISWIVQNSENSVTKIDIKGLMSRTYIFCER